MNPELFCSEYEKAVADLSPWLERVRASGLKEESGYALEQLLMRRHDAIADATAARLAAVLLRITASDARLLSSAGAVLEGVGVDVHFFLSDQAGNAARA